jgi:hypothetical protein
MPLTKRKKAQRTLKTRPRTRTEPLPSETTTAIVKAPPPTLMAQATSPAESIAVMVQNTERIRRFVSMCLNTELQKAIKRLKPGEALDKDLRKKLEIDWGTIPNVDKPFLMQPGAEKFLLWLNLRPKFMVTELELGNGHLEIVCYVILYSKKSGDEVFEGPRCSCSSMESNFRYRFEERDPGKEPFPSREQAEKLKREGLGKWRKKTIWAKNRRTGEEWVWFDRIENKNIHDERNKVRQMGEKRALVKCVRNFGAVSEIFTSDPNEWDVPAEEEGTPYDDADHTPGGRKIVDHEGFSPTGKPVTQNAKAKQTVEHMVEEQKRPSEPKTYKGRVEIDCTAGEDSPIIRGDIAELTDLFKQRCTLTWEGDWWHCTRNDIDTIITIVEEQGYKPEVLRPKNPPPPPSGSRRPETKTTGEAGSKGSGERSQAATPTVVSGIVVRVDEKMTTAQPAKEGSKGRSSKPYMVVLFKRDHGGDTWMSTFDKNLFPWLERAAKYSGINCELLVLPNPKHGPNVVGLKRIGDVEFEADGKTPIVDNSKREAGQRTLY